MRPLRGPMAPAVVVRFELEQRPIVYVEADTGSDFDRVMDWLDAAGYLEFVAVARDLADEELPP